MLMGWDKICFAIHLLSWVHYISGYTNTFWWWHQTGLTGSVLLSLNIINHQLKISIRYLTVMKMALYLLAKKLRIEIFVLISVITSIVPTDDLHIYGCFAVNVTCLRPHLNDCGGNYKYQLHEDGYNTPITVTISCPAHEYIVLSSTMSYISPYTWLHYCDDRKPDCSSESPCHCCTVPRENLCVNSNIFLPNHEVQRCNHHKQNECKVQTKPRHFDRRIWDSCLKGTLRVEKDYRCLTTINGVMYSRCYARWARLYYTCLPRIRSQGT